MDTSAFTLLLEVALTTLTLFNEKKCAVSIVLNESGNSEDYAIVRMTDDTEIHLTEAVYNGLLLYMISLTMQPSQDSDILLGAVGQLFGEEIVRIKYAELFSN